MPDNENNSVSVDEGAAPSAGQQYSNYGGPVPPVREKKNRTWLKVTAIVLACLLVLTGAGFGGKAIYDRFFAPDSSEENRGPLSRAFDLFGDGTEEESEGSEEPEKNDSPEEVLPESGILMGSREDSGIDITLIDTGRVLTAAEVYAKNVNSTVGITVGITYNYWGYKTNAAASGSGFIASPDGFIVTNYHVIEGANSIEVTMYDDSCYEAEVVGFDRDNDIAILKVEAEGLTPVIFGDSDNMNVGDTVIAIGNPLGELTFSLTQGVISALGREVTLEDGVTMDLIQTDCAINSGNSGGALFNLYGEVIGITNAKYSSSAASGASIDNIGFAIPVNTILNIVKETMANGSYSKPYIGVSVSDLEESYLAYGVPAGVAVLEVVEGGPAEAAGVLANDIITSVDGKAITCTDELKQAIADAGAGKTITLGIYRQGETLEVTLKIGEQLQEMKPAEEEQPQQDQGNEFPFDFGEGYGDGYGGYGDFGDLFGDLFGFGSEDYGDGDFNIWDYFN